jgi:hypothetical protein
MVLCDTIAILHRLPPSPGLDLVPRLPNALTPDDILHTVSSAIVHDPFRDFTP